MAEVTQLEGYRAEADHAHRHRRHASTTATGSCAAQPGPERRFSQSRAVALDMESATIAANGFRFRVPYGTLLCVSDKPLHGEIKLPGMANHFYRERVDQHLRIGMRAMELLREQRRRPAAQPQAAQLCRGGVPVTCPAAFRPRALGQERRTQRHAQAAQHAQGNLRATGQAQRGARHLDQGHQRVRRCLQVPGVTHRGRASAAIGVASSAAAAGPVGTACGVVWRCQGVRRIDPLAQAGHRQQQAAGARRVAAGAVSTRATSWLARSKSASTATHAGTQQAAGAQQRQQAGPHQLVGGQGLGCCAVVVFMCMAPWQCVRGRHRARAAKSRCEHLIPQPHRTPARGVRRSRHRAER